MKSSLIGKGKRFAGSPGAIANTGEITNEKTQGEYGVANVIVRNYLK